MSEVEKLKRAKHYIDSLANGIHPMDGTPIPKQEVINQVQISRCLFYVSEVLRKQIEECDGTKKQTHSSKHNLPFYITEKEKLQYKVSTKPIPASAIGEQVNEVLRDRGMRKVTYQAIARWLSSIGLLEEENLPDGKHRNAPTASGIALGISTEIRTGVRGDYPCVVYDENAQEFVLENLNEIMSI